MNLTAPSQRRQSPAKSSSSSPTFFRARAEHSISRGGGNTAFLAQQGLRVVGVDRSLEALAQGRELARRKNVNPNWIQPYLETRTLPGSAFDVVACTFYHNPKLYPSIRESLCTRGLLFYETYSLEQLRFETGPRNPAHLLQPSELLHAFGDWDVLFCRETRHTRGVATLVARKPAARDCDSDIIKLAAMQI